MSKVVPIKNGRDSNMLRKAWVFRWSWYRSSYEQLIFLKQCGQKRHQFTLTEVQEKKQTMKSISSYLFGKVFSLPLLNQEFQMILML
jgi:hypothetical protein